MKNNKRKGPILRKEVDEMSFEKISDTYSVIKPMSCALCGQDVTVNQSQYGQQSYEQRMNTNKGSASSCSC